MRARLPPFKRLRELRLLPDPDVRAALEIRQCAIHQGPEVTRRQRPKFLGVGLHAEDSPKAFTERREGENVAACHAFPPAITRSMRCTSASTSAANCSVDFPPNGSAIGKPLRFASLSVFAWSHKPPSRCGTTSPDFTVCASRSKNHACRANASTCGPSNRLKSSSCHSKTTNRCPEKMGRLDRPSLLLFFCT